MRPCNLGQSTTKSAGAVPAYAALYIVTHQYTVCELTIESVHVSDSKGTVNGHDHTMYIKKEKNMP